MHIDCPHHESQQVRSSTLNHVWQELTRCKLRMSHSDADPADATCVNAASITVLIDSADYLCKLSANSFEVEFLDFIVACGDTGQVFFQV